MKNFTKLAYVIMVILIPVAAYDQYNAKQRGERHFKEFYSSGIDSRISSVEIAYKGTAMKLVDGREFVFYPRTDKKLNDGNIFEYTAEKGDRVYKNFNSDTIYLFKGTKRLAYECYH